MDWLALIGAIMGTVSGVAALYTGRRARALLVVAGVLLALAVVLGAYSTVQKGEAATGVAIVSR
ncbi:hypothetical protein ACQP2F_25390 [Actinoplanes sp. CA-030573]|uniref:hypothetical protein n=1 Tax=Actinoplanes sp. CA-030573 TaxID=3239898 RepID=UPI003D8C333F